MSECANPNAPIKFCLWCNKVVYTCELDIAINNNYTCPIHPDGHETSRGFVQKNVLMNLISLIKTKFTV